MNKAVPVIILLGFYSVYLIRIIYSMYQEDKVMRKKKHRPGYVYGPNWMLMIDIAIKTVITFGVAYVMYYQLSLTVAWVVCLPFVLWLFS